MNDVLLEPLDDLAENLWPEEAAAELGVPTRALEPEGN